MQQWRKPAARWSAAVAVLALAVSDALDTGLAATAPAAVAAAVLAAWPTLRHHLPSAALLITAAMSIAATVGHGTPASNRAAAWWVAETAMVLALVFLGARAAGTGPQTAAVALAALSVSASPLRIGLRMEPPSDPAELVVLVLLWTSLAVAAVAAGRFARRQRRERERALAETRRAQRLSLARDLHDYVAHDVTGIVVQAQAAQVVGEREPAEALAALARIETAGLQTLASLDRTVHLLRDHHGPDRAPGGFTDIADLVRRFEETGGAKTRLDIDPELARLPIAETTGALAHRIVTEALTNVRRHAPDTPEVRIHLRRTPTELAVEVLNDLPPQQSGTRGPRRGGGHGLLELADSVAALDGTIDAGPVDPRRWRLTAVLPL